MKIRPLSDRVLIKRIEEKGKTAGGIIIPDTAKERPQEGEVIAAGPGKWDKDGNRMPMSVKEGDMILLGRYAGSEVKVNGVEHLIINENDILGIIEK
jgi:chaperonin GroES